MPPGLDGMDALSERFTANGTGGEDCRERTGETEIGWVVAKSRPSLASREEGMGGGGFHRRDWFDNR